MRRIVGRAGNGKYQGEASTAAQQASFAETLRLRRPPAISGTDSINFAGQANGDPFPMLVGPLKEDYLRQARAMGIEPNGKTYKLGLVRPEYQGRLDPEALVDSTADVKRVIVQRGWEAEGMVNVKGEEVEQMDLDKPIPVADDLVTEHLHNELEAEGIDRIKIKDYQDRKEKKAAQLQGT